MKKIYLLMLIALPFIYACSDSDEDIADSLAGTTWEATYTEKYYDEWDEEWIEEKGVFTLSFKSGERFTLHEVWTEYYEDGTSYQDDPESEDGDYEVKGTNVYLVFDKYYDDSKLTVKDGKLVGVIGDEFDLTFKKK